MTQNFRTAFRGFNQEDVVNYLEFMNNQYTIRVNQITSEVDYLRKKLSGSGSGEDEIAALSAQLQEANQALESLRSEHESLKGQYNALKNKVALMAQAEDRTEDLNAMEAVIEKLQAENSALKKRCSELSANAAAVEEAVPFAPQEPEAQPDSAHHADDDWGDFGLSPNPVLSHQELESDLEIYLNNLEPVDKDFDFAPSRREEKEPEFDFAPEREAPPASNTEDIPAEKKYDFSFDVEEYLPKVNKPEPGPVDLDDDFENLRRVMAKARKTLNSIDFDD